MNRHLFDITTLSTVQSLVPETLQLKNGTVEGMQGLRIDGKLSNVEVVSVDESIIHISALALLNNCKIVGHDILIEGKVNGEITATGKIEFAAGCTVIGVLNKSGEAYFHMLSDVDDLTIKTVKTMSQVWVDTPQEPKY